jgi:hypothetical protein
MNSELEILTFGCHLNAYESEISDNLTEYFTEVQLNQKIDPEKLLRIKITDYHSGVLKSGIVT